MSGVVRPYWFEKIINRGIVSALCRIGARRNAGGKSEHISRFLLGTRSG